MPATINGTTGFGGNLTGNVTGNVTGTASAIANGAVSAAKLDGAQSGSAPIYGCRAWVRFNGTRDASGALSTANTNRQIIASGNVASVQRGSTGTYTVTFTNAMPSANYAAVVSARHVEGITYATSSDTNSLAASTVDITIGYQHPTNGGTPYDAASVDLLVFA